MKTSSPHRLCVALAALILSGGMASATVEKLPFGQAGGKPVELYVLSNAAGMTVKVATYGATITEIDTRDRQGALGDVVLGFDSLEGYLGKEPFFGATVGRVGNRFAKGAFTLNGQTYKLATNDGANHLHGGVKGFDKRIWSAEVVPGAEDSVRFSYVSADGEEGYPGNCSVSVVFTVTPANELRIDYTVTTDKDTPANVTNHSYFNLGGVANGGILGHEVMLNADRYTPVDSTLIPTGELKEVAGTPMDFRKATPVGTHLQEVGGSPVGYDHNYVVNRTGDGLSLVARVHDPRSGRTLTVSSTEPGVQFYTGNFLDGSLTGKKGVVYKQYSGLCLETQHFPDSVNHPNFPSYVVRAGQTYRSSTVLAFSAD